MPVEVTLTLEWEQPSGIDLIPVEHLHFQRFGTTVYLTFGQVALPVLYDTVSHPPVPIRPVVRLVMSDEIFQKFAEVLARQIPGKDVGA